MWWWILWSAYTGRLSAWISRYLFKIDTNGIWIRFPMRCSYDIPGKFAGTFFIRQHLISTQKFLRNPYFKLHITNWNIWHGLIRVVDYENNRHRVTLYVKKKLCIENLQDLFVSGCSMRRAEITCNVNKILLLDEWNIFISKIFDGSLFKECLVCL